MNEELDEFCEKNKAQLEAYKSMLEKLDKSILEEHNNRVQNITNNNKSPMEIILQKLKNWVPIILFTLFSIVSFGQNNEGYVPNRIRVKLTSQAEPLISQSLKVNFNNQNNGPVLTGNSKLDLLNEKYRASKMKRVFPHAGKNEYKHIKHGLNLWYELEFDASADLELVAKTYSSLSDISVAEPIGEKVLEEYKVVDASTASTQEDLPMNDPFLSDQWHYQNNGSLSGSVIGSDINLFEAWEVTTGNNEIVVSIVDGGIDILHEDLVQNIWVNEVEKNGQPGVDDDNNGFIDDINGFEFTEGVGAVTAHDHGTHVAGTISAVNNNGVGVSGIAGGTGNYDGVKVMSCQVFNNDGNAGNFAAAIAYGADNGALISQNSWSYTKNDIYEQSVLDAIEYFIAEAGNFPGSKMKGGVVIFAAGNDGSDGARYPAYYPSTIAVASIGPNFIKPSYSNYGNWIDVTAPGGNLTLGHNQGVLSTISNSNYGYMQGTSMACPHVSGIAALIVSHYGSETFSNEELKNRIITGVKDVYEYNPNFIGKLGSGLIDAAQTLEYNSSEPPMSISNLELVGISQYFASLTWTVPEDPDDEYPISYIVYWSTELINDDSLSNANSVVVMNNDMPAGERISVEIDNLESLTNYYFAVKSIDRWGNKSELSNLINASTNEGPQISSDKTSMNIGVDVNNQSTTSDLLKVINNKEGILKWEAYTRDVSQTFSATSFSYPELKNAKSVESAIVSMTKLENNGEIISAPASTNWTKSSLKHYSTKYPGYVIGENDSTVTNSMATRFYVENELGFNLTHVSFLMKLDKEDGPAIFEVYKGNEISSENLVYSYKSASTSDGLIASKENDLDTYTHKLKEQLFFDKNDVFWVVYHIPAGNLHPLGIYPEASPELSGNCLMSFDQGKTWATLEEASGDGNYVWAVEAKSLLEPLQTYISISPNNGQINGVGENELGVEVDASNLINGNYKSNLIIESNDGTNRFHRVPLNLNVYGHKPELNSQSIVSYGDVFLGLSKSLNIEIQNLGYGKFYTSSIVSSNPDVFKIATNSLTINALGEANIPIEFVPDATGNHNGTITLTSNKGDVYEFNVYGVGSSPSELSLTPSVLTFNNVDLRDTTTIQEKITISNTGDFPLQYGFTKFVDNLNNIDWVGERIFHKYGYAVNSYEYPENYVFNDISQTGVDVTWNFKNDGIKEFVEVDLGFEFPYFGDKLSKLYITKRGMLTLGTDGRFNATMWYQSDHNPDGYICAFATLTSIATQGSITYSRDLGKFTVQYTDVASVSSTGHNYTFQIVLYDNGDIEFVYDKIEGYNPSVWPNIYAVIENASKTDGVILSGRDIPTNHLGEKRIIKMRSPGSGLIESIVDAKGTILPGQSKELLVKVNRDNLVEGNHTEYASILSNDPFKMGSFVEVNINVTAGGSSNLMFSDNFFDYGDINNNEIVDGKLKISNNGDKPISIVSITSEKGDLIYSGDNNFELKPSQFFYLKYRVNTSEIKEIDDKLILVDSEGVSHEIQVLASVNEAPVLVSSVESFTESLEYNEKKTQPLMISNEGSSPLELTMTGSSLVYPKYYEGENAIVDTNFTYVHRTTYDEIKSTYGWYNIGGENKIPFFSEEFTDFWHEYELPFTFEFYNKKYSKLWIGLQGLVSFTEPENKKRLELYPHKMGVDTDANNIIAPFYGNLIYQDWEDVNRSGVFYKEYEDKIVIEWREFFHPTGGNPFDFQLVLFNDGRFKFQYGTNRSVQDLKAIYGSIGIESENAEEFTQISYFQRFAGKDVSVEFSPARKEIIEGGSSKNYDIVFDATDRFANEFNDAISIVSNDPLKQNLVIPASVVINGDPIVELSEELNFGEVIITPNTTTYSKEFYVKNTGIKRMNIRRIKLEHDVDAILQSRLYDPRGNQVWLDYPNNFVSDNYFLDPGKQAGPFRILLKPKNSNYIYFGYSNKLVMNTDFGTKKAYFDVSAKYSLPPVASINRTEISHISYNNDQISDSFIIGNVDGKSDLEYSISLDYNRVNTAPSFIELSSAISNEELNIVKREISPSSKLESVEEAVYNRVLSHDSDIVPDNAVGVGGNAPLTLSTRFIAPSDGFKLSHVQTWYIPESIENSEIRVEIRVGRSIEESTVQHSELFNHYSAEFNDIGAIIDFKLSEPVLLMPYESFYVTFTYPKGIIGPQGTTKVPNKPKTFWLYYDGTWSDIQTFNGFTSTALMIRAAELEAENLNWLEISELESTIAGGQEKQINLTFIPERSRRANNNVLLSINSNDPINPVLDLAVKLRINQGPELVIDGDYSVFEEDTLSIDLNIVDIEGDDIKSVSMPEYENVQYSYSSGVLSFEYTPTFTDSGMHTFEVICEDNTGAQSTNKFYVDVVNVNKSPIVVDKKHIILDDVNPQYKKRFNEIFSDPDFDEMNFTIEIVGQEGIAKLFVSGDEFIIYPIKTGFSRIELTATDAEGDKVTTHKNIVVNAILSDEELLAKKWSIYPNPVKDILKISLDGLDGNEFEIKIYSQTGACIKSLSSEVMDGYITDDLSDLSSGVYLVEIVSEEGKSVNKFIKD